MLKETITYTDFNGLERTEEFWFNLTKNELIKMEHGKTGRLSTMLEKAMNAKDISDLFEGLESLIFKAYGEKSEDGRRFVKSDELSTAFMQSAAYDVFFDKLTSNPEYAYKFITGMVPADLAEQASNTPEFKQMTKQFDSNDAAALVENTTTN